MLTTLFVYAAWQEATTSWDLRFMWGSRGPLAEIAEVVLFLVCIYFFARLLDRFRIQRRLKGDPHKDFVK
jgi:hypothetical protein